MVLHFGRALIAERDAAMLAKNDDYNKYKNALYDDREIKLDLEKAESQLQLSQQREQHLKERVEMYKEKISMINTKLASTQKEASRFRQHHAELCQKYSGQDEAHYKQVHVSILCIPLCCFII